jgi:hypothetical protein
LVFKVVDKPAKIWHITVALLIVVHLQLNKNNYFNFAKARREKRSRGEREGGKWSEEEREEARERRGSVRTHTGEHKRERVRGGCLGAEGR